MEWEGMLVVNGGRLKGKKNMGTVGVKKDIDTEKNRQNLKGGVKSNEQRRGLWRRILLLSIDLKCCLSTSRYQTRAKFSLFYIMYLYNRD